MSGATLPYHVRPHKAVDRRLFLDLLSRFDRWRSVSHYTYISMGAYPLEDQKQIHRSLGLKKLISFDYDKSVVERQKFNKPIEGCHCLEMSSSEMITNLDDNISQCGIKNTGVIFWLDYTSPREIQSQIREFQTLLDTLAKGDVVRITINAEVNRLGSIVEKKKTNPGYLEKVRKGRLKKLKEFIGDYLPGTVTADQMTEEGLPIVYAQAIAEAARKAFPSHHSLTFLPLSLVRYADGQQMLSITGTIIEQKKVDPFLKRSLLRKWPFWSKDWSNIHKLVVPTLTLRERMFLEKSISSKSTAKIIKEIGFKDAGGISMTDFLASYKKYYRFYPSLLRVDL